jgi:Zn-dependent alcohol dehydrogenase
MPTASEAAILRAHGSPPALAPIELRDPAAGEVLVRIVAAGICHTDLAFADGEQAHPLPVVLGHEGAGVVEAVGPGVAHVGLGDRVVLNLEPGCGECRSCRVGRPVLCARWPGEGRLTTGPSPITSDGMSVATFAGASCFARHAVVAAASAIAVPDGVPDQVAAVVGCAVITGFGAATEALAIEAGSRGAVVGLGPVGASALMGARLRGAAAVVAVDPVTERRGRAPALGATEAVAPADAQAARGTCDWAIVAAGRVDAVRLGIDLIGSGGVVVVVGTPPEPVALDVLDLVGREKTIRGSSYGTGAPASLLGRIFDLYLAGRLELDALVSARLPLAAIAEGFERARAAHGMRVVLVP